MRRLRIPRPRDEGVGESGERLVAPPIAPGEGLDRRALSPTTYGILSGDPHPVCSGLRAWMSGRFL